MCQEEKVDVGMCMQEDREKESKKCDRCDGKTYRSFRRRNAKVRELGKV